MSTGGQPRELPLRLSIALISTAALAYEILLTRLFSIIQWHHFAYMVISLALLGYGASGSLLAVYRDWLLARFKPLYVSSLVLFGVAALSCFVVAQRLAISPEELLWSWRSIWRVIAVYLLLALPFFFAAGAIGLALSARSRQAAQIYAADLLGAGLGAAGATALLFVLYPQDALRAVAVLGTLAAVAAARGLGAGRRGQLLLLGVAVLPLALPEAWLALRISPYKALSQSLQVAGTQVLEQRSGPLGLVSVIESPRIPLRHAPGLSLHAAGEPPEQLGVFIDADGLSVITRDSGDRAALGYLDQTTDAAPYHLIRPRRVLVLGAGGGAAVLQALVHLETPGAARDFSIDAVELNPQVIALVREEHAEFAGGLYSRDGVTLHAAEARGFVARGGETYDLITLSLLDSFAAASAGLYALSESYLYTVEALQEYLERLAPGGILAITRWVQLPPRDLLKLFATATEALERGGVSDAGNQLALIRGWQTGTLLVKNGELTAQELAGLRRFCRDRAFDLAWLPGMSSEEANRYNLLARPYLFEGATALLGDGREAYLRDYKFNLYPATDDRPYFFHFFDWAALPEILSLRGAGLSLLEAGYLILVATLVQALLASLLLVLAPLGLRRHTWRASRVSRLQVVVYFLAIGLAFLALEMAFIQKLILYLHHPVYAVTVTLAAFLVFAGLGSASTHRAGARGRRRASRVAALAVVILGSLYLLWLDALLSASLGLPAAVKVPIAVAIIAPVAFFMGMPFPLGIAQLGQVAPALVPWAWAVNGCASVVSAVAATLLAMHAGFSSVLVTALACYAVSAAAFPATRAPRNR